MAVVELASVIDQRNHDIYPARYDEVKRALYGTMPEMPGQMELAL